MDQIRPLGGMEKRGGMVKPAALLEIQSRAETFTFTSTVRVIG